MRVLRVFGLRCPGWRGHPQQLERPQAATSEGSGTACGSGDTVPAGRSNTGPIPESLAAPGR